MNTPATGVVVGVTLVESISNGYPITAQWVGQNAQIALLDPGPMPQRHFAISNMTPENC
jgi:hypothetical protein